MRLLILSALVLLPAASAAAPAPKSTAPAPTRSPGAATSVDCPKATNHYALRPGEPMRPQKLGELPPATAYMAVYRTDSKGCLDPLTVVEYRSGGRR